MDADRNEILAKDRETLTRWHRTASVNQVEGKAMHKMTYDTAMLGYAPTAPYKPLIEEMDYLRQRQKLNKDRATASDKVRRLSTVKGRLSISGGSMRSPASADDLTSMHAGPSSRKT